MPAAALPPQHGARDAFLYLVSFFLLYVSVASAWAIILELITQAFPEPASSFGYGLPNEVPPPSLLTEFMERYASWVLAAFFVAGPLYFLTMWWINRQLSRGHLNPRSSVRRWLTYLSLFVAASIIVIDLIIFFQFLPLRGKRDAPAVLAVLTVLVLAGLVFVYYLLDIRRADRSRGRGVTRTFSVIAVLIYLAVLVGGFPLAASFAAKRELIFNVDRLSALQNIESAVQFYVGEHQRLPASLAETWAVTHYLTDPQTGVPYEYRVTGPASYELCALFTMSARGGYYINQPEWQHDAGRACFQRTVRIPTPRP